jgi:hypothetical protein
MTMNLLTRGPFRLVLVAVIAACGEGGGASPIEPENPGEGPGHEEITEAERTAVFRALDERMAQLQNQALPRDALNTTLAAWLEERPEFESAGVAELSSVWAVFRDGRVLVVANNRDPIPPSDSVHSSSPSLSPAIARSLSPRGAARAEATALPEPRRVRLLHSLGIGFTGQAPIDDMAKWFRNAGYEVAVGAEGDASVDVLRTVSGDAFFYFNTHGARADLKSGESYYVVGTSTVRTEATDSLAEIKADLAEHRLVYLYAPNGVTVNGKQVWDERYAITHKFVDRYMSFGRNGIVFLNVCGSTYPSATVQAFTDAVKKKGAGVYAGWSHTVNADPAYTGVRYFVDRLLGANEYRPEDPEQRPFGWQAVLEEMQREGLDVDPVSGAKLTASAGAGSGDVVGPLAPSIRQIGANQWDDELVIVGAFGEDTVPDRRVTIAGGGGETEMTIKEWTPEMITVELPRTGAGSSGDVVVEVDGVRSNPRKLMAWTGTLVYTVRDLGSLTHRIEMDLDVRLDPASFRMKPGEEPMEPVPDPFFSSANRLSEARYTASGAYTTTSGSCTTTTSWSGSKKLEYPDGSGFGYSAMAAVDVEDFRMDLFLALVTSYTHTRKTSCSDGRSETYTSTRELGLERAVRNAEGWVPLYLDAGLSVKAGTRSMMVSSSVGSGNAVATLQWSRIGATPEYDPQMPR